MSNETITQQKRKQVFKNKVWNHLNIRCEPPDSVQDETGDRADTDSPEVSHKSVDIVQTSDKVYTVAGPPEGYQPKQDIVESEELKEPASSTSDSSGSSESESAIRVYRKRRRRKRQKKDESKTAGKEINNEHTSTGSPINSISKDDNANLSKNQKRKLKKKRRKEKLKLELRNEIGKASAFVYEFTKPSEQNLHSPELRGSLEEHSDAATEKASSKEVKLFLEAVWDVYSREVKLEEMLSAEHDSVLLLLAKLEEQSVPDEDVKKLQLLKRLVILNDKDRALRAIEDFMTVSDMELVFKTILQKIFKYWLEKIAAVR